MADVLHSALTGNDLHECKGAAAALQGTVPVANGAGSAPFTQLNYSQLAGKPSIPAVSYSGGVVSNPVIKNYLVTAALGIWTQSLSGFSQIHAVQAQAVGSTAGNAAASWVTTVTAQSISSVSGQVWSVSGSPSTGSQQIYLTVYGV